MTFYWIHHFEELVKAKEIHGFKRGKEWDWSGIRTFAVKVWYDDKCQVYIFHTRWEYAEFIEELNTISKETSGLRMMIRGIKRRFSKANSSRE